MADIEKKATEKKKSSLLWVGLACAGFAAIILCIFSIIGLSCFLSDDFQEGFKEGYCGGFEDNNMDPSEDPLGICN
ncbi:hypothetical protein ACFLY9_02270 [Patescibacteria group bacterium]